MKVRKIERKKGRRRGGRKQEREIKKNINDKDLVNIFDT